MALDKKTIELWDGYEVEINEELFDDVDFLNDMNTATRENDLETIITMTFAVVGGQKVYDDVRKHIEAECDGRFSMKELSKILGKIGLAFPKVGNRASRRQKWSMK